MLPLRLALVALLCTVPLLAQTVESVGFTKLTLNRQTGATPTPFGYGAGTTVTLIQPVTGAATLRGPLGTKNVPRVDSRSFSLVEAFLTRGQLEAQYPNGTYTLSIDGSGVPSFSLSLNASEPRIPAITNFADAQAIATPSNFRLTWAAWTDAGAFDYIGITIRSDDGQFTYSSPTPGLPGALTSSATGIDLNLPADKRFTAELFFLRSSQLSVVSGAVVFVGWANATQFALRTLGVNNVAAPAIAAQPVARTAAVGGTAQFSVTANGGGTLAYQWRHNSAAIPGATTSTLTLPSVQQFQAGSYTVVVSNAGGTITSASALLSVTPTSTTGSNARLANLSTRGLAGTGAESLIPGFVITGTAPKRVLIRAIGPALTQFGLSASDVVADPTISLVSASGTTLATNDDWSSAANAAEITAATTTAGAFALPPGSRDAALLMTLQPGGYTALVSGKTATPSVAIVEVYDLDPEARNPASGSGTASRLVNIATRGLVGTGDRILIPGFVVTGNAPKTYVIRGIGPSLAAFGQPGAHPDPVLSVYQGTTLLFSNDDWSNSTTAGELVLASRRAGAFELPSGSRDAALLVTLQPGAYTFQVSGNGSASGTALVEVYEVP